MNLNPQPTTGSVPLSDDPTLAVEQASAFLAGEQLDDALMGYLADGLRSSGASWLVEQLHQRMLSRGEAADRPATLSRRSFERDNGAYRTPPTIAAWMVRRPDLPALHQQFIDPACGAGQLLVAAAEYVLTAAPATPDPVRLLVRHLRGTEADPLLAAAARVCLRSTLWPQTTPADAMDHVVSTGDGLAYLLQPPNEPRLIPHVVANPPFQGVVERGFDATALHAAPGLRVGGTANLAGVFWDRIDLFVTQRGYATVLMPRNLLVSEATTSLRDATAQAVDSVWLPASARLFAGADVYVCVLHLNHTDAQPASCTLWTGITGEGPNEPPERTVQGVRLPRLRGSDWWPALCGVRMPADAPGPDWVEIRAGMTTGDAYRVRDYVAEAGERQSSSAPRLLTTGLVDPGVALWGTTACRFLKGVWTRPVIVAPSCAPTWLVRLVERAARPKIVVAGLCARWEMFLDERGQYAPSVGTWVIYDRRDDVSRLRELVGALERAPLDEWMQACLGANAMSGGSMTITRGFLEQVIGAALAHALKGS